MSAPRTEAPRLRIGILGAARIADDGIVTPARILGHELVGVAARDRTRAEAFAAARGINQVYDTYADLVADPEIDVVYNALINSEHTRWNIAALEAGRHVLSEKPMSGTAEEARQVERVAASAQGQIVEGFHYLHHPVNLALRDLILSGWLGEVQRVELVLATQAPPPTDPRWSAALLGGATMDLGCYVLNAARQVARWLDQPVRATSAQATFRSPGVDSAVQAELTIGDAISLLRNLGHGRTRAGDDLDGDREQRPGNLPGLRRAPPRQPTDRRITRHDQRPAPRRPDFVHLSTRRPGPHA